MPPPTLPAFIDPDRRPFAGALALGLLHAITFAVLFPPFGVWPLAFLTLLPLILVAAKTSKPGRSALAVWLAALPAFGFHHFWLREVTLAGMPLLVMYMSLYPAIYTYGLGWVRRKAGIVVTTALAIVLWPALELVRGELFAQGYPWYVLGQSTIELSGIDHYTASLVLVIVNVSLCAWTSKSFSIPGRALLLVLAVLAIGSSVQFTFPVTESTNQPATLRIAVVQTNVPQSNKQRGTVEDQLRNFDRFIELTLDAANNDTPPDLIVWPETMVPVFWGLNDASYDVELREGISVPVETPQGTRRLPSTYFRDELTALQSATGIPMLVGATAVEGLTFTPEPDGSLAIDFDARYNSAFLIEDGAVQPDRYNKIKLTPFGEVMPYISAWPWLEQQLLALGARDMEFNLAAGRIPAHFEVKSKSGDTFRIATPICFEITYANTCRRLAFEGGQRRTDILINLTNDGWFGDWDPGRETHLDSARWRAAELDTPVVRAANTGISCLINKDGSVQSKLPANEDGVLVVDVPKGTGVPLLAKLGFLFPWIATTISAALLLFTFFRGNHRPTNSQDPPAPIADDQQSNPS